MHVFALFYLPLGIGLLVQALTAWSFVRWDTCNLPWNRIPLRLRLQLLFPFCVSAGILVSAAICLHYFWPDAQFPTKTFGGSASLECVLTAILARLLYFGAERLGCHLFNLKLDRPSGGRYVDPTLPRWPRGTGHYF